MILTDDPQRLDEGLHGGARLARTASGSNMHASVTLSGDRTLGLIGWAAARRGDVLHVVLAAGLSPRMRAAAMLAAMTDEEYELVLKDQLAGVDGGLAALV